MAVTVTVQDESSPGNVAGTLTVEDIPAAITLRDLIRHGSPLHRPGSRR